MPMPWLKELTRKALKDLEPYKPGKPIEELKRELGLKEAIKLCSNENPWPLPNSVIEAANSAIKEINRYPDPEAYRLRRAIAKKWGVSPAEVIVGGGTEGILYTLFQAILEDGEEVVFPFPTYPLYGVAALAAGGRCVKVSFEDGFAFPMEALKAACTDKTKAMVLCNPNNPTGNFISRHDLLDLAAYLESQRVLLIVDEAYADFVDDPSYLAGLDLFREIGKVVIIRTFSKAYGLAALRVAFAIAPTPVVDSYAKVRSVFEVNTIAQRAALAALAEDKYIEEVREKVIEERGKLFSALSDIGLHVINTTTNFLLILHPASDEIYDELLKEGIIVRPGKDLGLPNSLRVSIGIPEENEQFIIALKKVLKRVERR